jgi:hypothetical protein
MANVTQFWAEVEELKSTHRGSVTIRGKLHELRKALGDYFEDVARNNGGRLSTEQAALTYAVLNLAREHDPDGYVKRGSLWTFLRKVSNCWPLQREEHQELSDKAIHIVGVCETYKRTKQSVNKTPQELTISAEFTKVSERMVEVIRTDAKLKGKYGTWLPSEPRFSMMTNSDLNRLADLVLHDVDTDGVYQTRDDIKNLMFRSGPYWKGLKEYAPETKVIPWLVERWKRLTKIEAPLWPEMNEAPEFVKAHFEYLLC